jgi:hypothetical protein
MTANKGYYSVVQYCPDPSRLETVNFGVVLFCPERRYLGVEFTASYRRLRKLFGELDEPFLEMQKHALAARLSNIDEFETREDLDDFISRRTGGLRLSVIRPMQVEAPEIELKELLLRLVGAEKPKRQLGPRARTLFAKELKKEHLIDLVRRPMTVQLPEIGKTIRAEYGYKNGRYNLLEPVDFTSEEAWFKVASARAVEGQAVHKLEHPKLGPMKMIVVGRFGSRTKKHEEAVAKILATHKVDLYALDRMGPLIKDIKEHLPLLV